MYLCGLALFTAHGPAVASALIAFSNQMVSCSRGSRCWIFPRSRSACWRSRHSSLAFGNGGRNVWFALARLAFGLSIACKWSGLFALAIYIVIVAVIRLMQCWQFVDDALRRGNGPP
jgi:dolichyl-phosphate-mannose-protein mannosyltransferase